MILLLHKSSNALYEFLETIDGFTKLRNVSTGNEGEVANEKMKDFFSIPVHLNVLITKNPNILPLIKHLDLGLDPK